MNADPPFKAIAGPSGFVRARKSNVFALKESISMPIRKNISANLVTIKAFLAAATAESFV